MDTTTPPPWCRCSNRRAAISRVKTSCGRPPTFMTTHCRCCCRVSKSIPAQPTISRSADAADALRRQTVGAVRRPREGRSLTRPIGRHRPQRSQLIGRKTMGRRLLKGSVLGACIAAIALPAWAQNAPGVTDTEISQTMPYTGPVTAFSTLGKGEVAYFKMLNDQGGVNGRKTNLLSLDDVYAPPRTVEQTRKLVEQDGVAFIFSSIGT